MRLSPSVLLLASSVSAEQQVVDKTRQLDIELSADDGSRSDETIVHSERVNLNINPTNRLNKLTQHAQNFLQSDFSDWSGKDRLSSNFDRLNEKMLSAYNRCGGGADSNDDEEVKSGKDRAISKDPCEAVKQITVGFRKWSDRFMADCGSHQKNPQIPKKMDKFKEKLISHLQTQGKCLKTSDEFTKPKSGQVIATFDELGPDFTVSFDLKINSAQNDYSNILFATSASADKLAKADFDDLLKLEGDIKHSADYPEINRHPGIWVMPGKASDDRAGLMICGEYVKWENSSGRPLERCFSYQNIDSFKKLIVGEWYEVKFEQYCWEDEDYYYDDYYDYYDYYGDYSRSTNSAERFSWVYEGCDTRITINGPEVNFSYQHTMGNRQDAFQTHKDVTVYGAIPSNAFNPANVKINNFSFKNEV